MRIDVHAHLWTDEYLDLLIRYGKASAEEGRGLGADATARDLDARFAMMDAASVDLQVLSASPQLPSFLEEPHAAEAARHVNDLYARVVREHPDRFAAFAAATSPTRPAISSSAPSTTSTSQGSPSRTPNASSTPTPRRCSACQTYGSANRLARVGAHRLDDGGEPESARG
jgi:hypothetical protein